MNTHNINIIDRNTISVSGINKMLNFDKEEFKLDTIMGLIEIKGEDLEIIKLDTIDGNLSIKGKINGLNYIDKSISKDNSIINRLFK